MAKSYLDQLVEYPAKALHKIGTNKDVVALLLDDWNVDMDSDAADAVFDQYLFDYLYVDSTTDEARAYICSEIEVGNPKSITMQDFRLYVTVICHKNFMKLDPRKCSGLIGNRRDNLVRSIDLLLNGSDIFGIGTLCLASVKTIASPAGFTTRELTYKISDFKDKGINIGNTGG